MIEKGTEFLPEYIKMLIKYSGGYGFERRCYNDRKRIKYNGQCNANKIS